MASATQASFELGQPEPRAGAPPPDAPAAAPTTASLLGLTDPEELDDLKEAAVQELTAAGGGRKKRPKLTHGLFFEEENGLKCVLKTFPRIKFQGKGNEFEDLKVLIRNYERWFKDVHPFGEHFEDLVYKTRNVLQEKERDETGIDSDPHERLHLLRFAYKNMAPEEFVAPPRKSVAPAATTATPAGKALPVDVQRKIEESRARALQLKQEKEMMEEGGFSSGPSKQELDMDTMWRIEEKRARALELKRRRESGMSSAPAPSQPASAPSGFDDEEDPFGFGFGGPEAAGAQGQKPKAVPPVPAFEEEEDPFGFGFEG